MTLNTRESNSKHRVAVEPSIFGHRVVASLTGRTMSTPDTHKPELVEVAVMRTDDAEGLVWVPKESVSDLTYEVRIEFHQEDFASPTDAVLGMIAHLRHPQANELSFNVRCVEDNVTYGVEAQQADDGTWGAYVHTAYEPGKSATAQPIVRHDLIPGRQAEPTSEVDTMVDAISAKFGDAHEITPHRVAVALREANYHVGDAQVLQVHDILLKHSER